MATKGINGAYIIEIVTHLSFVIHIFFKLCVIWVKMSYKCTNSLHFENMELRIFAALCSVLIDKANQSNNQWIQKYCFYS